MPHHVLACALVAVTVAACSRTPPDAAKTGGPPERPAGPKSLLLFKADPGRQQEAAQTLKAQFDGQLIKVLPQSQAEVWSVPQARAAEAGRAARGRGIPYLEMVGTPGNPVLAEQTVAASQLTVDQRRIVDAFTSSLDARQFRVTEARPAGLSADVFSAGLAGDVNRLSLELLAGQRLALSGTGVERRAPQDFTWRGRVDGGAGDAILVIRPEGVTGTVRLPDATYSIMPLPDRRQLILRVDPRQAPPDHPAPFPRGGRRENSGRGDQPPLAPCADPTDRIDILLVYTPAAAPLFGASPQGFAQLLEADTNQAFARSQLATRAHVTGVHRIALAETSDLAADLKALVSPSDGIADNVHALRRAEHADAVVMLVAESDEAGLSEEISAHPASAFAAVAVRWAPAPNYSFAHELGHLFGARHDPASDATNTPFPYGHGYVQSRWRTIMALDTCGGCGRIQNWSNPSVLYPDSGTPRAPTGLQGTSEEARVIRDRAAVLARFQCAVPTR